MNTFEHRHEPGLGQSFVNGAYELGEVRRIVIAGRDILYRLGSASLDNSCCGNHGCAYALVIGAVIEDRAAAGDGPASSLLREISADEPLAAAIRAALMEREAIGVVNFALATAV